MTWSAVPEQLRDAPEALACRSPAALPAIGRADTSLVIWQRPPIEDVTRLLDPLPPEALPDLRLENLPASHAGQALEQALPKRARALAPLLDDIARLARLYGTLAAQPAVRLRLERVTGDACRRFHADHVRLRLLCTYRGPGTEWLPAEHVHHAADGSVQPPVPGAVRQLGRFEVGLLKGIAWPGSSPCFHRSPPIAGTGMARLLLCIDEGGCC